MSDTKRVMSKKGKGKSGKTAGFSTGLPSDYKADERILAPIPGVVTKVYVKAGQQVKAGDPLLVIEAMKMRNMLRSAHNLAVASVNVREGDVVKTGQLLLEFVHDR